MTCHATHMRSRQFAKPADTPSLPWKLVITLYVSLYSE